MRLRPGSASSTGRRRRIGPAIAVLLLTSVVVAACGDTAPASVVQYGGVFRLGSDDGVDSLNPFVAMQPDAQATFEYIYPTLVEYNTRLRIVPDFATSWQLGDGGKVWTFHTQRHARWSDGRPLTASDAAWTFATIVKYQHGPTAALARYVLHLVRASAPNATTLVLSFDQPVADALGQLQHVPILPKHVWAQYAGGNASRLDGFANHAPVVSGGPYRVVEYTPGQNVLFKPNDDFYGPKPHVQGLALEFFATPAALVAELKSGRLDAAQWVPPASVGALQQAGFKVTTTPGDAFDDLIVNDNPAQDPDHKELLNPLVREAFSYAIDRVQIVTTALSGFGAPGSTILPPAAGSWSDTAIKPLPYDLAKANELLNQAGYQTGSYGLRVAYGNPMAYTVIIPADNADSYSSQSFAIIQADFRQIGVQLTPDYVTAPTAYQLITADHYKSFELAMWDSFGQPDPDSLLFALTCDAWSLSNDTGYCSKGYDGLYEEQSVAVVPTERRSIVDQMQQMISQANAYLVIDYPDTIVARSSRWRDLPLVAGTFWNSYSAIPFESVRLAG